MPQALSVPFALRRPDPPVVPRMLLPRRDAAAAISVSVRTLDDRTSPRGPIRCVRIGRRVLYSPAVLQQWIDSQTAAEPKGGE